jgi:hypothetical protein
LTELVETLTQVNITTLKIVARVIGHITGGFSNKSTSVTEEIDDTEGFLAYFPCPEPDLACAEDTALQEYVNFLVSSMFRDFNFLTKEIFRVEDHYYLIFNDIPPL